MSVHKYNSFEEIDRALEILNIEKEISYHKLVLSVEKTKENIKPKKLIGSFFSSSNIPNADSYLKLLKRSLPFVWAWYLNKKRGR